MVLNMTEFLILGETSIMDLLIKNGADQTLVDNHGNTASQVMKLKGTTLF